MIIVGKFIKEGIIVNDISLSMSSYDGLTEGYLDKYDVQNVQDSNARGPKTRDITVSITRQCTIWISLTMHDLPFSSSLMV